MSPPLIAQLWCSLDGSLLILLTVSAIQRRRDRRALRARMLDATLTDLGGMVEGATRWDEGVSRLPTERRPPDAPCARPAPPPTRCDSCPMFGCLTCIEEQHQEDQAKALPADGGPIERDRIFVFVHERVEPVRCIEQDATQASARRHPSPMTSGGRVPAGVPIADGVLAIVGPDGEPADGEWVPTQMRAAFRQDRDYVDVVFAASCAATFSCPTGPTTVRIGFYRASDRALLWRSRPYMCEPGIGVTLDGVEPLDRDDAT